MKNQSLDFLRSTGRTLADYDGACVVFVGDFIDRQAGWDLAYLEPVRGCLLYPANGNDPWNHHAVACSPDGLVHDPWFPELVLPLQEYLEHAFPGQEVFQEFNPGFDS